MAKRRGHENTQAAPRDNWCTPREVIDLALEVLGTIGIDPASNPQSIVPAELSIYYSDLLQGTSDLLLDPEYPRAVWGDGLQHDWAWARTGYINPPYGRGINAQWAEYIERQARAGLECIALVPASPGAKWFRHYWRADAICFWEGRLQFLGAPANADFESAVIYYGPQWEKFRAVFGRKGHVIQWHVIK